VVLKDSVTSPDAVAREHAGRHGAEVEFVYSHALKGYSATIPTNRLASIRADSRVAYVEADGAVTAMAQTLPWGVDKIDADLSSTFAGNGSGAINNVNVYVIDTGIDVAHTDLNVVEHVNFAGGPNKDCNGHGTHVAGTIAAIDNFADVVGVAPGAPLHGVKVLGCGGSGTFSGVIKGVDWVTAHAIKPAIANMSLGGGGNTALDDAVHHSADSGIFYSLAAGNSGADACSSSPARAGIYNGVATVAATDSNDSEASWSNYGLCVDIWAPGVNILSTKKGGGTTTMSGTSMASPHVGGGGALYLSTHTSDSPAAVEAALKSAATVTSNISKGGETITREYVRDF
jgi:subtilisin family serine protease